MAASIDHQVEQILLGSEFGDPTLAETMGRELRERLVTCEKEGRPLRVYAGYDPSKPDLHLGHAIGLRKLRLFQDFGHDVTFLVGTFTAQIGDASDKTKARDPLAAEQAAASAQTYVDQVLRILDADRLTVVHNGDWLSTLTMADVVGLAEHFTVQQFLERDNFRKRIGRGDPVRLREFLYPLMQGYDAVHLRADVQLGGTEQLFNIMAGRKLQTAFGQPGCVCLAFPILVGVDGVERMSKSTGNYIGIGESPDEQFGKAMSISDDTMRAWLPLVTRWSAADVAERLRALDAGEVKPMDLKKDLAAEIVAAYHGDEAATAARDGFAARHQRKEAPQVDDLEPVPVASDATVVDALVTTGAAASRSAARRLVEGRGVRLSGDVVEDAEHPVGTGGLLQVGKRRFYRVVTN